MWEVTEYQAAVFSLVVRLVWLFYSGYYTRRAWREWRINHSVYMRGRGVSEEWLIVRRRRMQRSRAMFFGFLIGFGVSLVAVIGYWAIEPRPATNLFSAGLSIALTLMLVAFSRAKEADIHMRLDAEERRAELAELARKSEENPQ